MRFFRQYADNTDTCDSLFSIQSIFDGADLTMVKIVLDNADTVPEASTMILLGSL